MILYILIALAVVVVGLYVLISTRKDSFRVARSATIPATASTAFELVNNFHNWAAWSPWTELDSNTKITFDGPTSGVGAKYDWAGNNKVGVGRMILLDSEPASLVRIKIEFLKPFQAVNTIEFTFVPAADGTVVTWAMFGPCNFQQKAFSLVMDCDKMCGPMFEKGLANMRNAVGSEVVAKS